MSEGKFSSEKGDLKMAKATKKVAKKKSTIKKATPEKAMEEASGGVVVELEAARRERQRIVGLRRLGGKVVG